MTEWIKQHKYAVIIVALSILLFCCSCLFIAAALDNKPAPATTPAITQIDKDTTAIPVAIAQPTNTVAPTIQPTNTPIPTKTPVPTNTPSTWVTVATLSGDNNKLGDVFEITGNKVKLTYTFTDNRFMLGAIYVMPEGTSLDVDGGIPVVLLTHGDVLSDSTFIVKKPGKYYIQVIANSTTYTVTLEQQ